MDLIQLIHELEKRGAENGLVTTLRHRVDVPNTDEVDKESGKQRAEVGFGVTLSSWYG